MEKAIGQRYNISDMISKIFPTYENDYTGDCDTQIRPLPEVAAYDTYFVHSQNGTDLCWEEDLFDQDKLEYRDTHIGPSEQIEVMM